MGANTRLRSAAFAASLACVGACTPALTRLDVRLTDMQRRVAELAAQGLSNRQIGEALRMSPRTAATHLHRAYKVLGVNTRDQIGKVLGTPTASGRPGRALQGDAGVRG